MNTLIKTLILTIALLSSSQMYGQFGKQLGKRVSDRVKETTSRKVENKAEEKTEKVLDKIFTIGGGSTKSGNGQNGNDGSAGEESGFGSIMEDMMNGKEVEINNSYSFGMRATIVVETYEGETAVTKMDQTYGKGAIYTEMEVNGESYNGGNMIHDFKNEAVIVIDEKNKTAQAMSLAWMDKMLEKMIKNNGGIDEEAEMKKTGRTRKMHGYTCHEYVFTDSNGKMIVWFAPDVNFDYSDYMSGLTKGLGRDMGNLPVEKGYVMAMEGFEADGSKSFKFEVTALSESPRTIDLSTYNVTKLF